MNFHKVFTYFLYGISIILHPLFLPVYLMIWFFFFPYLNAYVVYFTPLSLRVKWIILYALLMVIMPLMILILSKLFKVVESFMLHSQKDRKYFFLLMGIYYWFVFFMFKEIYANELFKPSVLLSGVCSAIMFLASVLNFSSFKLSIHTAGMGAFTGFFAALILIFHQPYINEIVLSIGLTAIVMLARFLLHAHDFLELLSGWVGGLFMALLIFLGAYHYFNGVYL